MRRAVHDDAAGMGRLGALLVEEHHAFDARRFLPATQGTAEGYGAYLDSQLDEPDVVVLVADERGSVIGYAYAEVEGYDYMSLRGPAAVLHDLIVAPERRSEGVGGRLLEAMLAELAARGAPRVVLSTAFRNEAAQRMFERMGFRRTMVEMTRELEGGRTPPA